MSGSDSFECLLTLSPFYDAVCISYLFLAVRKHRSRNNYGPEFQGIRFMEGTGHKVTAYNVSVVRNLRAIGSGAGLK